MRRWVAIRSSAALAVAGSVATLAFSILMVVGLALTPARDVGALPPTILKASGIVVALLFAGVSVWGICSGIGIFRRRNWARVSIVIFAGLLAFFGGTGFLMMLLVPFPADASVDQRLAAVVRSGLVGFHLLMLATGAWWLILFNRRPAKEYFAEKGEAGTRPLSITIIGWWLLSSALVTALAAALRVPGMLFGLAVTGWSAALVYTGFTATQVYLGAGLLGLDKRARVWSILYFCVAAANSAALGISSVFALRLREAADRLRPYSRADIPEYPSGWAIAVPCIVLLAIPIWFLVRHKAAFAGAGEK